MDAKDRHAYGAHFTSEADILRIVNPTIVEPWQERIDKASTMKDMLAIRTDLLEFKVLDPACGSGNFLYVSYREMVRSEIALLAKLKENVSTKTFAEQVKALTLISPYQFYGIDRDSFGVELAKVSLMIAKKLGLDEAINTLAAVQTELPFTKDEALPLDNLDDNFICGDALFELWPCVDTIVSNPPYQSKNKMQKEFGRAYLNTVRDAYPEVSGRADYCVYWFKKAHDHLSKGQRAGFVGTNTIRQNYSRTGGLDHIVADGGTITEAVSSMKWSGDAAVDVSIVNWLKGTQVGKKRLYIQKGGDPSQGWSFEELDKIGPALSFKLDVTAAKTINANAMKGGCFQGQTHGRKDFLLSNAEAKAEIASTPASRDVLYPYLIADELIGRRDSLPRRHVIDFQPRSIMEAQAYKGLFARVKKTVLPARKAAAADEAKRNQEALAANSDAKVNHHHANFLKHWWLLSYPRDDMVQAISGIKRYISCGCVTLRPVFEFIDTQIRPNAALMVFPYEDDYSFGVLQSDVHWNWFINRCSTLAGRFRYTSNTVFDSFPWPQNPSESAVAKVAKMAVALRTLRNEQKLKHNVSLRELYRIMELPGAHPLKVAHLALDKAVREAYGMKKSGDPLPFLLELNAKVAAAEVANKAVTGPGLPKFKGSSFKYTSKDCVKI